MKTYTPADFGPFILSKSSHASPADGMCVMEMVSFLAGEEWSDMPACSSPVVSRFCQVINDKLSQAARDRLQAYVHRLIGTASPEHDAERAEYLAWQAIKVFAPYELDKAGLKAHATVLWEFDKSKGLQVAADAAARIAADAAAAARAATTFSYACADAADAARAAARAAAYADATYATYVDAAYAAAYIAYADVATDLIFKCLDGLLEIGPSGTAYSEEHLGRIKLLRAATKQPA